MQWETATPVGFSSVHEARKDRRLKKTAVSRLKAEMNRRVALHTISVPEREGGGATFRHSWSRFTTGLRTLRPHFQFRVSGDGDTQTGRSLREKKSCPLGQFCKKTTCSSYVQPWLVAIGCWRLVAISGWQLAVGGGWWRLAVGDWWLLAVGSGWRFAAVGGGRLLAVGPLRRSLRVVLSKKNGALKDRPAHKRTRCDDPDC